MDKSEQSVTLLVRNEQGLRIGETCFVGVTNLKEEDNMEVIG